ncbi:GNAT family N-acetyltransferase [Evansella sp. AB-P1]|uniref:GNAT family N-acetyltransferase n=1 Tax=Evansella sp. AB-P1 TaxID=3037653 RepID=UPI00241D50A8|nr:GNAT family N-acetyltransferase [Evansella sp. AB-P1]MDG5790029.1 GNAT family N-acetyltransferase [Evansella sp. AB-P1]
MRIRDAEMEELSLIRNQRVCAYEEYALMLSHDHWLDLKKSITSDSDIQPGVELIVAEDNGEILGSVALFPPNTDAYKGYVEKIPVPELRMLAISLVGRGRGIGSALVNECIDRTKRNGYNSIGLHSADVMTNAIKLYERFGFNRVPELDFEPSDDGILVKAYRLDF